VANRYAALVAAVRAAVLDGEGVVDPAIRRSVASGDDVPALWQEYAAKVRDASYRITDQDVAALKAARCSEEEIFEVTVAAATGAALRRLDAGLRALGREG
jgi:hypothetical protein